mmetsp:Transcript_14191/g.19720  ORF Transcript_14191/g.19720 Transcript_14191/m.19720 type:complete len:99 (+) Transcript_14191:464-760(+)
MTPAPFGSPPHGAVSPSVTTASLGDTVATTGRGAHAFSHRGSSLQKKDALHRSTLVVTGKPADTRSRRGTILVGAARRSVREGPGSDGGLDDREVKSG